MAASAQNIWTLPEEKRLTIIDEEGQIGVRGFSLRAEDEVPGLKAILLDYARGNDDHEDIFRRLLKVIQEADSEGYQKALSTLPGDCNTKVAQFVDGKKGVDLTFPKDEIELGSGEQYAAADEVEALEASFIDWTRDTVECAKDKLRNRSWWVFDKFTKDVQGFLKQAKHPISDVKIHKNKKFRNWGLVKSVEYTPAYTCVPSSVAGVQSIIKAAKKHNFGVRCSGYRHSWSPLFGRHSPKGQVLISLLEIHSVTRIPDPLPIGKPPKDTEIGNIEIVTNGKPKIPTNTLVRVGASVTNEALRRWCLSNKKYTIPLNVIMVEITIGGSNAPICHGAGIQNKTLSDLVRKIEYVDCNGQHQVVDDERLLRAAAGCFGLMGVITHLTLEFEPMGYAIMKPEKKPAMRAVPPPTDMLDRIPDALRLDISPAERESDIEEFEANCKMNYAEWFWFPYNKDVWVNCWIKTYMMEGEVLLDRLQIKSQILQQALINCLQYCKPLIRLIQATDSSWIIVTLLSMLGMRALPTPEEPVVVYLPEALHFQRGIQNTRVLDLEVEIPLPAKPGNPSEADFDVVRRAWWDAILKCYEHGETVPQQLPVEMRIMGGSDVIMAPQLGNRLGTCAIEILTLQQAEKKWIPYAQEVLDQWMSYKDAEGNLLRTRPHWAKQWYEFTVARGPDGARRPWVEILKEDLSEDIVEFKERLKEIGALHGWELADLKQRFSNEVLDFLYF